jgi:hypothetical protein
MTTSPYLRKMASYIKSQWWFGTAVPNFLLAFYSNFCRILNRFRVITVTSFGWDFLFPAMFLGQMTSKIWVLVSATPKGHFLAPNHVVWAINHESRSSGLGWGWLQEKKGYTHTYIQKKCTFSLYFTLTWGAHGLTDLNQIRHTYRSRRRNKFY